MSFIITGETAARELERRDRSREDIRFFAANMDIPGVPIKPDDLLSEDFKPVELSLAIHHIILLDAIQRCMTRANGRLMAFMPPGAAKSTYGSVVGPSWRMGCPLIAGKQYDPIDIGIFGYGDEIAIKQSRRVRSMCRDPLYSVIWEPDAKLSQEKAAADQWQLSNGSSMFAGGMFAATTGFRFGGIVIDDPVKNREDADSESTQTKIYDEYNDTILTRLIPGGWLILIQTRWSELDLSSRLLPEDYNGESGIIRCQDGQDWEVLCIPAKYEEDMPPDPLGRKPGEYLWTQWFKPGHWDKWEKNKTARRTWSALCQQKPTPKEGIQFTRSMFKRFSLNNAPKDDGDDSHLPATLHRYGASDYATLDDARGDFSEHGCVGMDWKGDLWFTDWWYGQKATDKSIDAFIHMIRRNRPLRWANEGGVIDHAIRPAVARAMREANTYVLLESYPSIQDKASKLLAFHARCSAGTVHVPDCAWGDRLIDVLCKFPAVKYDDAADVCGLIGRMLDKMAEAAIPKVSIPREVVKPFTEKWWTQQDGQPKGKKSTSK